MTEEREKEEPDAAAQEAAADQFRMQRFSFGDQEEEEGVDVDKVKNDIDMKREPETAKLRKSTPMRGGNTDKDKQLS